MRATTRLSRGGFTMVEVVIGIAIAGITALVLAGIFKAGIISFNYGLQSASALSRSRKELVGDGPKDGLVWTAMASAAPSREEESPTVPGIDAIERDCFKIDLNGKVSSESCEGEPNFVTYLVRTQVRRDRELEIFSGVGCRNHP